MRFMMALWNGIIRIAPTGMALALLFRCTSPVTPSAGGGTQVGNGVVVCDIRTTDGQPARDAIVRLRTNDYLTKQSYSGLRKKAVYTADDTTDADGRFIIDSVSPGEYRIEVTDQESTAVLLSCTVDETSDSVVDLGTAVLRQFAAISGVVQTTGSLPSASVGVYGLERRVAVDSATGAWRVDDLPAGDFRLRIEPESDEYGAAVIDAPYVSAGDSASLDTTVLMSYADEDYAAWAHSRSIRINTTPSGADITDDVYTFPLLVRLDTTAINFAQAAPDGRDIRFSKSDGTPLRYEIDFWNTDSSRAGVWVLMDTVRGNDSTQSITMHWGGPAGALDFSSPSAVFDTANGHAMVWHVNETPARDLSVIRDATANGVDGVASGPDIPAGPAGVIGTAMRLVRPTTTTVDTIRMSDSRSEAIAFSDNSFTISFWARKNPPAGVIRLQTPGYSFEPCRVVHEDITLTNSSDSSISFSFLDNHSDFSAWNLFAVVVDRVFESVFVRVNGKQVGKADSIPANFGNLKTRGLHCIYGSTNEELDEIRLDRISRSAAWLQLSYETQRPGADVVDFR